jgi:transketolase
MRKDIIEMTYRVGSHGAHIGGSLSMVEIMAVLYMNILKYDKNYLTSELRDRLILSKGHGAMALYAAMKQAGIINAEELLEFKKDNSRLSVHPQLLPELGIETASGSLGMGLSMGVGIALALKKKKNLSSRVFVVSGDGECNEGSVWEAAMSACHFGLNNLRHIVDYNNLQYDGLTSVILRDVVTSEKWRAFGWQVIEVDGHNICELVAAMKVESDKPVCIIAHTIKGKGVSFMENNAFWHAGNLREEQYKQALAEQVEL